MSYPTECPRELAAPGAWSKENESLSESDSTTSTTRVCTKCGHEYPATLEYFYALKSGKYGLQSQCKECRGGYRRSLHAADPEKFAAQQKAWRDAHPGYAQAWWAAHTLDRTEYHRAYSAAHREEQAASSRAYRIEHPDYHRDYRAEHPDQCAAMWRNHRARKRGNGGTHTAEDIQAQYARQKGRCFYCSTQLAEDYEVDHVTPLSRGGSNGPENLVVACMPCNRRKAAKPPQDFCGRLL